jgi:lipopolysaccharide transport system ATP-binding protein
MKNPIITATDISKLYRLGKSEAGKSTFREAIKQSVKSQIMKFGSQRTDSDRDFWALQDVSFEVAAGDIVGLIGRNGAGKSTLLKILTRITEPTRGRAVLRGRVGALLEVGTGFHPELTGRENIFLNGAILGMKRVEITRQFDRIVAFAQIDRFLDTPVKRYSSGMYVRLAFAVAAHLEPEILIIDEVLAVGDTEFQRKCMGRMDELRTQAGRTIFLVSHNLEMIESLCTRGIVLEKGRVAFDGKTSEALDIYKSAGGRGGEIEISTTTRLKWQGLQNRDALRNLQGDDDIPLELAFSTGASALEGVHLDIELSDEDGRRVTHSKSKFMRGGFDLAANSNVQFSYTLKEPMLAPGRYYLLVYAYDASGALAWIEHIEACDVTSRSYFPEVDFIADMKGATVPKFEVRISGMY